MPNWEITNMPGPMAMPVPGSGVKAGEKFEVHLSREKENAVVSLLVHTTALMTLDSELKKLEPEVRTGARLTIYPRVIRVFVADVIARGWDPKPDSQLEMDSSSMQALLNKFKKEGLF